MPVIMMGSNFWENVFWAQLIENAGRIIIQVENAGKNVRILFSGPAFSVETNVKDMKGAFFILHLYLKLKWMWQ